MSRTLAHLTLLSILGTSIASAGPCDIAYWDAMVTAIYPECQAAAVAGDPEAQFGYAQILWSGHGHETHREQAIEWYRKAAKQGHRFAQLALGRFLSDERSPVVRNPIEAYAWYAVLDERTAMQRVASTLSGPALEKALVLASEYIASYRRASPEPNQPPNPMPESFAPRHAKSNAAG